MKKELLLIFSVLFLFSCGSGKIEQGEIEYAITYPNSDISGFMEAILPEKMTITFKGTKVKTNIARGKIFTTEIISDESDKSVEMRLDFGDKLFYSVLDENEIQDLIHSQPDYHVSSLNQTDSLVGTLASSYSVEADDDFQHADAWFTTDFEPQNAYWFTSYADAKGLPLIYDAERYGVMMHLEAVKFTPREVQETEFDRDPELIQTTFEEYENEVQELFDILME